MIGEQGHVLYNWLDVWGENKLRLMTWLMIGSVIFFNLKGFKLDALTHVQAFSVTDVSKTLK